MGAVFDALGLVVGCPVLKVDVGFDTAAWLLDTDEAMELEAELRLDG